SENVSNGVAYAPPRIEGVVLSVTDVSALERVRARLRQLSAIVESSTDAIIGITLDGVITTWNNGAETLYGYSHEEAVGSNIDMLAAAASHAEITKHLSAVSRGDRIEDIETLRVRKDGKLLDVSVVISPVFDFEGNIAGGSVITRDVTAL